MGHETYEKSPVAVLQSFRTADVPQWVIRCQHSVHRFATSRGWDYIFMDDGFFELAPPWVRETLAGKPLCILSDVCRLEWMRQCLERYTTVFWADIDLLVIDGDRIQCDTAQSHGFAYESYFDEQGPQDGINNAFMFFNRSSGLLEEYLRRCYAMLEAERESRATDRTALGPNLLRELPISPSHIIRGLDILNFNAMRQIYNDPHGRMPIDVLERMKDPLGAANLCLNERGFFSADQQPLYDAVVDRVVQSLLNSRPGPATRSVGTA